MVSCFSLLSLTEGLLARDFMAGSAATRLAGVVVVRLDGREEETTLDLAQLPSARLPHLANALLLWHGLERSRPPVRAGSRAASRAGGLAAGLALLLRTRWG